MISIPKLRLKPDIFLYACREADVARTLKNGSFNSHLRWDSILFGTYKLPLKPSLKVMCGEIDSIISHHAKISPQFRRNEDIDLETISYFTVAITTLFADIDFILKQYTGFGLPRIPAVPIEFSGKYPLLNEAIAKFQKSLKSTLESTEPFALFPLDVESDSNDDDANAPTQEEIYASELWDIIADGVNNKFGDHSEAMLSYAFWHYQFQTPKAEIDWRIRPPVGDLFYKNFKGASRGSSSNSSQSRNGPRKSSNTKDSTSRPSRRGEAPTTSTSSAAPATPAPTESRPEKHAKSDRPQPRRDYKSDRPHDREKPASTEESLNEALNEVRKAAARFKKESTLSEMALKPQNSFIRREQHSLATELGLETESRGEGKLRTVYLKASDHN